MPFAPIPEAIEEFRKGHMLVVVDDEDRENEGDLTVAAELVTPEIINFMAKYGRGLICLPLSPDRCDALDLPLMARANTSRFGTAFCESIEAREGVTTGISAADRARTIQVAIDPNAKPDDLARPGHVFPLRAREGGVLVRAGQTEAAVDLARLAGLQAGGVICEIMNDDGTMARVPQLVEFCRTHDLRMISVADLIRYRLKTERLVIRHAEGVVKTPAGEFRTIAYRTTIPNEHREPETHMALIYGDVENQPNVLVRMHSHCVYGAIFASLDCQCRWSVDTALRRIAAEGAGVLVYLHQTGPGIHILDDGGSRRLAAHVRTDPHAEDAPKGPIHESGIGAQILADLGLTTIRLLTNHPRRVVGIEGYGIQIVEQASY